MRFMPVFIIAYSTCCTLLSHAQNSPADFYLANPKACQRLCDDASDALYKFEGAACVADCQTLLKQRMRDSMGASGLTPIMPIVRPSGNNRAFILHSAMVWEIGSTGVSIDVPKGFVTDFASIPRPLWSVYSPHDQYSRAAVVHDYLYWSQLCTREQADNLFMIAMKESEVSEVTRNIIYSAVVAGGESAWETNRAERLAGMPKVVPLARKDFHPNATWETYRKQLVTLGIKDPIFTGNDYCVFGDSTEVPLGTSGKSATRLLNKASLIQRPKLPRFNEKGIPYRD